MTQPAVRVVLASASPARLATLRAAGVEPEVVVSGRRRGAVDEHRPRPRLALAARRAQVRGGGRLGWSAATGRRWSSVATRCSSWTARPYGKPADADDAVRRWRSMRGRDGVLHTGHSRAAARRRARDRHAARSRRRSCGSPTSDDDEVEAYVATGEPLGVAGGFTIDGLGGRVRARRRRRPAHRGRAQPAAAARPGGRARDPLARPVEVDVTGAQELGRRVDRRSGCDGCSCAHP